MSRSAEKRPTRLLPPRLARFIVPFALFVPLFLPLSDELRFHVIWGPLGARLHILIFAAVTLYFYHLKPGRRGLGLAVCGALICGIIVELLQPFFGRTASVGDLLFNLIGIGLAAGYLIWRIHGHRSGLILVTALAVLSLYQSRDIPRSYRIARHVNTSFPVIADFEDPIADGAWSAFFSARIDFPVVVGSEGDPTRVLAIRVPASDTSPGASTVTFPLDWCRFADLCFDLKLHHDSADTVLAGIRLEDVGFLEDGDWFSIVFPISRQWKTHRLPLEELRTRRHHRPLDCSRIITLKFFAHLPDFTCTVMLDNVRLE